MKTVNVNPYPCSFCGKTAEAVAFLISGPDNTFICDECVEICAFTIAEHRGRKRMKDNKKEYIFDTPTVLG